MTAYKITKKINSIKQVCTDLLYPRVCPVCNMILESKDKGICRACRSLLPVITEPVCLKCGKEISDNEEEFCEDCSCNPRAYTMGFPAMNYVEPVKDCVMAFKYRNRKDYADFFAEIIYEVCGPRILSVAPEIIVPVPIHSSRLKERGYNQAGLLAKELSARLHIPVEEDLFVRTLNTLPQKNLTGKERETNLKKAFNSCKKKVKYKSALLVDDIYTTGATIEACTAILQMLGIQKIYYTSICIGKGY